MLAIEALVDEHDGAVIETMSQAAPDSLIQRSECLLVVPSRTAQKSTTTTFVVVASLLQD